MGSDGGKGGAERFLTGHNRQCSDPVLAYSQFGTQVNSWFLFSGTWEQARTGIQAGRARTD